MRPLHIFYGILVAAIWGGNFVAAKFALAHFPPFFLIGIRFCIAALLLVPFVKRPTWRQMQGIASVSLMLGTLHFAFMFDALYEGLDIASSVIVGEFGVPFACLLGAVFLGDKLGIWRISGMAIAFAGIAIVAGTPNILSHQKAFWIAMVSTCCWGIANILIKRIQGVQGFQLLGWMSLFAVPVLFMISAVFESGQLALLPTISLKVALSLSYTVLASTFVAYGLWYFLLERYTVSQVTPFSLLVPLFGIASGQLFFNDALTPQVLIGGAISIIGVAIIIFRRPATALLGEAT